MVTTAMGIDPVFSSRSVLYNPRLSIDDWYNTKPAGNNASSEINDMGYPYGFFIVPGLEGYEQDGFPVSEPASVPLMSIQHPLHLSQRPLHLSQHPLHLSRYPLHLSQP